MAGPAASTAPSATAPNTVRSARNKALGLRPRKSRHRLLLATGPFRALMAERGKHSIGDIAAYLELGFGTVRSALLGRPIGDAFVSALAKVLHGSDRPLQRYLIPIDGDEVAA